MSPGLRRRDDAPLRVRDLRAPPLPGALYACREQRAQHCRKQCASLPPAPCPRPTTEAALALSVTSALPDAVVGLVRGSVVVVHESLTTSPSRFVDHRG